MNKTLLAFALIAQTSAFAGETRWITPDFFTEEGVESSMTTLAARPRPTDCRAHIRDVVCLVNPGPSNDMGSPRPCLPGGEPYAVPFEELYDHSPPALQRMYCSLNKLYIEKSFFGTAYAGTTADGVTMGIRKSVLDESLSLSRWATWKEQLSFGGKTGSYDATEGLPVIVTGSRPEANDFLYFVVSHEFGHLFDFANHLNRTADPNCKMVSKPGDPEVECDMHKDSWGALSWKTDRTPLPQNEFANRSGLCFYWCEGNPLNRSVIPQVYKDLVEHTNFLSIYATTQPWDDFADSLAYYLMRGELGTRYVIDTAQGTTYDIMAKLESPRFASKADYIRKFLDRSDIVYP